MDDKFDLVIVGAGSAGIVAAKFAGRVGAKVALVDSGRIGGDCTWTGCVPSKALIRAARAAYDFRSSAAFGTGRAEPEVDWKAVSDYVCRCIEKIYGHTTPGAVREWGVAPILGRTGFLDPHTLRGGATARSRGAVSALHRRGAGRPNHRRPCRRPAPHLSHDFRNRGAFFSAFIGGPR